MFGNLEIMREVINRDMSGNSDVVREEMIEREMFGNVSETIEEV